MCDCGSSSDRSEWYVDSQVLSEVSSLSNCNFDADASASESGLLEKLGHMEGFGWGKRPPSDGDPAEEPGTTGSTVSYLVRTAKAKLACRSHEIDHRELEMLKAPITDRVKAKVQQWLDFQTRDVDADQGFPTPFPAGDSSGNGVIYSDDDDSQVHLPRAQLEKEAEAVSSIVKYHEEGTKSTRSYFVVMDMGSTVDPSGVQSPSSEGFQSVPLAQPAPSPQVTKLASGEDDLNDRNGSEKEGSDLPGHVTEK